MTADLAQLTDRQAQVIAAYVVAGNAATAAHWLGISPATLRVHLRSARRRTGVETTMQLVALLASRGELGVRFATSESGNFPIAADEYTMCRCPTGSSSGV